MVGVDRCLRLAVPGDLLRLIPRELPSPFHTADLAAALDVSRGLAQRIAYCLRETGAVSKAGKQGNAWLYRLCA